MQSQNPEAVEKNKRMVNEPNKKRNNKKIMNLLVLMETKMEIDNLRQALTVFPNTHR